MKLALTQFVTIDGVTQGPGAADEDRTEGFERGGWLVPHMDARFVHQTSEWLDLADGLVLGRRTYEAFARDWPQMTDPGDPFTLRMNSLPKFVITNTLRAGDWAPTTVLRGNAVHNVAALKERTGGELQIHGSARLGASLLSAGLVDTIRLVVAPTVIGAGRRLFPHPAAGAALRLVEHDVTSSGLLLLEYEVTGSPETADYSGVTDLIS